MLIFSNCKINIGLNIIGRRSDGYHDLETVFYPIHHLHDAIEILPLQEDKQANSTTPVYQTNVRFQSSGFAIAGSEENNLCLKAYHLVKKDYPELPPVQLYLHKAIPMGAGLGGGSADGAFTLLLLNQKFNLKIPTAQLLDYALQLGSDCPFFIVNKPCFAWGRGEMLSTLSLQLSGYSIILIHPGIHIATAAAFSGITPRLPAQSVQELILQPVATWKENIVNDFEKTVFTLHPQLQEIKNKLYDTGAAYASMSGSGSTIYGIYAKENLPKEPLYPDFFEHRADL